MYVLLSGGVFSIFSPRGFLKIYEILEVRFYFFSEQTKMMNY